MEIERLERLPEGGRKQREAIQLMGTTKDSIAEVDELIGRHMAIRNSLLLELDNLLLIIDKK